MTSGDCDPQGSTGEQGDRPDGGAATDDAPAGVPAVGDAPAERVFDALADDRRRTTLSVLAEEDGPLDVRDLARAVAHCEIVGEPRAEQVDRVHVSLYHVHLPKLADAGLVAYDRDRGTVDAAVDAVRPLLSLLSRD